MNGNNNISRTLMHQIQLVADIQVRYLLKYLCRTNITFCYLAVPVYNNILFIVFGRDVSGIAIYSMIILNVTVPSDISYLSAYVDPNGVARETSSPGLSKGATAGIAVGTAIGVSTVCNIFQMTQINRKTQGLIIITALFCVWKKRKDKKKKEDLEEIKRQNERIEAPVMEVNWDAIDRKYTTNPATNLGFTPQFVDDEATMADNTSEPNTHPVMIPQSLDLQRPNAIENNANNPHTTLEKPDGGYQI